MLVIILAIIVLWIVLLAWSFHSLGSMDKLKKIQYLVIGIAMVFVITFLVYQISKIGITFPNDNVQQAIQTILLFVFTAINGYLVLPFMFKTIGLIRQNKLDDKQVKKRLLVLLILFILLLILESSYLKGTQQSILKIMEQLKS